MRCLTKTHCAHAKVLLAKNRCLLIVYIIIQPVAILAQLALAVLFFIPKYEKELSDIANNDTGCSDATVVGKVIVAYGVLYTCASTHTTLH